MILSESVYLQFWAHWVLRAVFLAGFCSNMSEVLYEISVRNMEPSAKMHKVPLIWMLAEIWAKYPLCQVPAVCHLGRYAPAVRMKQLGQV